MCQINWGVSQFDSSNAEDARDQPRVAGDDPFPWAFGVRFLQQFSGFIGITV